MLHQLNLKMLIGLVMVSKEVVDTLEKSGESPAIILFLQQKFFLRESLNEVDESITSLSAERLGVRSQVGDDCNDRLVDRLQ